MGLMSVVEELTKKIAESAKVATQSDNISKAAESLAGHQDKLAGTMTSEIAKATPDIERGVGQDILKQVVAEQSQMFDASTPVGNQPRSFNQEPMLMSGNTFRQGIASGANDSATLDQYLTKQALPGAAGSDKQTPASIPFLQQLTGAPGVEKGMPNSGLGNVTKGKNLGDDLYNFIQSVGYGMLDRPLNREASTWDYLGKTIGQIARVNEGSGLGAGSSMQDQQAAMVTQQQKAIDQLTPVQFQQMKMDAGNVEAQMAKLISQGYDSESAKLKIVAQMSKAYGPKYMSYYKSLVGLPTSPYEGG